MINQGTNALNSRKGTGVYMKTVTVKIMGSSAEVYEDFEGRTLADLKEHIELEGNYTANIGGSPAEDTTAVNDHAFVVFSPSVKGA